MVSDSNLFKEFIFIKDSGLMINFQGKEGLNMKMATFTKVIFWREINKDLEKSISKMDNNMKDFLR